MAEIITRKLRVKHIAERYRASYERTEYWAEGWPRLDPQLPPARETHKRLKDLGSDPDPDAVDAIFGRTCASLGNCDECGEDVATAAEFDINCGEFSVEICGACCRDLADAIDAADRTT